MTKFSWRRYVRMLHLYLGMFLGAVFVLLGLTGSFLVFYPEIDRWLNPALVHQQPLQPNAAIQTWFDQLHEQFPERQGAWRIELPRQADQVVFARYLKPEERDPNEFSPIVVALDPSSGAVLSTRIWGEYLVTWMYDLHYSLLMGQSGKAWVSVFGIALIVSVILGLCLWVPRGKHRLTKAMPKVRNGSKKAVYDIHSYAGAYGAAWLLLIAVTGVGLATPHWLEPMVNRMSVRWDMQTVPSVVPLPDAKRISADQAVSLALTHFPNAKLRWIEAPVKPEDAYVLRLQQAGEPSERFPKTFVWVDPFAAQVLASRDPLKLGAADVFFDWLHPLHNGEAFGRTGRILAVITGCLPLVLMLTGWLRWRQKNHAQKLGANGRRHQHPPVD